MRKSIIKRAISLLLLVIMLIGVMPMNIFAEVDVDAANKVLNVLDGKILESDWNSIKASYSNATHYKVDWKTHNSMSGEKNVSTGDTLTLCYAKSGFITTYPEVVTLSIKAYRQLTLGSNITGISGDNIMANNRVCYDANNATPTIKVLFTPATQGYSATVKYLGEEVGTYAAGVGTCDITVTASGSITVEYNKETAAPGNVDISIAGSGNVAFNGGKYTSSTNNLTSLPGEYTLVVTPNAQNYVKQVKITVDGVTTVHNNYAADRSITATFTVESNKEYTVDVVFEAQKIVTGANVQINWNGSWDASALSNDVKTALKLEIIRACIAEGSIPSSAIYEVGSYTITFLSRQSSSLVSEKWANLGEYYKKDGILDSDGKYFGADFYNGKAETVKITYNGSNVYDSMTTDPITVTLKESRPERPVTYIKGGTADTAIEFKTSSELLEKIKENVALTGLDWNSVTLTYNDADLPTEGVKGITVTVTTDGGDASYQGRKTFVVYVEAEAIPASVTINFAGEGSGKVTFNGAEYSVNTQTTLFTGSYVLSVAADGQPNTYTKYGVGTITVSDGTTTTTIASGSAIAIENGKSYTVTVEFTKTQFTASTSGNVKFNPFVSVAEQMKGGIYRSDVANGYTLEESIFNALNIQGVSLDKVTVQYFPRKKGNVTQNYSYSDQIKLLNEKGSETLYTYYTFGQRFVADDKCGDSTANEKVRIAWNETGLYVDATVTLVEGRIKATITGGEVNGVITLLDSRDPAIEAVKNAGATVDPVDATLSYEYKSGEIPNAGETGTLVYTIIAKETATTVTTAKEVTVAVKGMLEPSDINVTNDASKGTVTVTGDRYEDGRSYEGSVTVSAAPVTNSGYYVKRITVNGVEQTLSYANGVASFTFNVVNNTSYDVDVEYAKAIIINDGPYEVLANGFISPADQASELGIAIYNRIVNVGQSHEDFAQHYTISVYDNGMGGFFAGWKDLSYFTNETGRLWSVGSSRNIKLTWAASNDGRFPEYSVEVSVKLIESRHAATIIKPADTTTISNGKYDTLDGLKEQIYIHTGVYADGNALNGTQKDSAGLEIVLTLKEGTSNIYIATATVKNDGEGWLRNENAVDLGEYTFNITSYTVKFYDENGDFLWEKTDIYNTGFAYGGIAPTKAPTAEFTYTFIGWDADGDGNVDVNAGEAFTIIKDVE